MRRARIGSHRAGRQDDQYRAGAGLRQPRHGIAERRGQRLLPAGGPHFRFRQPDAEQAAVTRGDGACTGRQVAAFDLERDGHENRCAGPAGNIRQERRAERLPRPHHVPLHEGLGLGAVDDHHVLRVEQRCRQVERGPSHLGRGGGQRGRRSAREVHDDGGGRRGVSGGPDRRSGERNGERSRESCQQQDRDRALPDAAVRVHQNNVPRAARTLARATS
jgi:hypothetical protein